MSEDILREATEHFVGKSGIVAVGAETSPSLVLKIFMERPDPDGQARVLDWARSNDVDVDFVVSGKFVSGKSLED